MYRQKSSSTRDMGCSPAKSEPASQDLQVPFCLESRHRRRNDET
jgi:hypothetical protein